MIKPLLLVIGLTSAVMAHADTTLNFIAPGNKAIPTHVTERFVRMEMSDDQWVLYDAESESVSIVDDRKKEYSVVDEAVVKQLGEQIKAQRQQAELMLKTMPPEQRKQMERMLGQAFNADKFSPQLKDAGDDKTIAGISCKPRDVYVNGEHKQRVCVADPKQLGMSDAELSTVKGLFQLFSKMPVGPKQPSLDQFGGVPVEIRTPQGASQQTLASVSHNSIPASEFTIPAKYFRRQLN